MAITLSGIFYYPVKSLGGVQTSQAQVSGSGLRHDRRWMLVDGDGTFVTQRDHPSLTRIRVEAHTGGLRLWAPGMPELAVAIPAEDCGLQPVTVWRDSCQAQPAGAAAAAWLGGYLGRDDVQLVYLPSGHERQVDTDFAQAGDRVGFADGFPFLMISEASLADLNDRLPAPISMSRFRPNLVVSGCGAYAEDDWRRIRIGDVVFRVSKPCSRCKVTTIDPLTAETGAEPLRTLATYRRRGNEVYFGQNLVHEQTGLLHTGLPVEVLD